MILTVNINEMKNIIFKASCLLGAFCLLFSCDKEIESINLQPQLEYSQDYFDNLKAYKEGFKDRSICFVWFSDYQQNTSLGFRFAGLPDSIDICSLWGGIPDEKDNPLAYKEMWEMRNNKGTKLVIPTIIRIMENENYANFGLSYEDMVNQKTTIDASGVYPDWCVLYGDYLLKQMNDNKLDGLDLDYEPESGDERSYGIYGERLTLFVKYLGQFIGPKSSNPEKMLIVDFYGSIPSSETEPYVDYFVQQYYGCTLSEYSFNSDFPNEKQVFTENIGDNWQTGGNLEQQAGFQPSSGYKGGFGAFFCQRDYYTTESGADKEIPYGHLRKGIQLQNPAVIK